MLITMIVMVFACSSFVDLISDESDWEKDADIQRVLQESVVDTGCQSSRYFTLMHQISIYLCICVCLLLIQICMHC